jgi:basic amino acid/polyamine antiporter, APA family
LTDDGSELRRSIGLIQAILITVGAIIGSGIFVALGPATAAAGHGLLLAMVVAGAVALMNGLSSSQLGINFPVSGGTYAFAREVGHKTASFVAGAAFLGKEIVGLSVIALAFAHYTAQAVPGLPPNLVAAATLVLVTVLNVIGLEPTAKVLIVLTIGKVVLLLAFVGLALPAADPAELTPVLGTGPTGVLAGAAVFFFAYAGYSRIATIAAEIERPRRNVPVGIAVGFAVAAVVFLLVGATTLGVLGPETTGGEEAPVFTAAEAAVGELGGWIVLAAAWMATLSVLVGGVLGVSRVGLAMARESELPQWLGEVSERFRTPARAVVILGLLSSALALTLDLRPLVEVTAVFTLVYYSVTNGAAIRLTNDQRTLPRALSWIGLGGCLALLISLPLMALAAAGAALLLALGVRVWQGR